MLRLSCFLPLLIVFALCAAPGIASAEPTASERETARSLMDEADALRDAGELWRALERYTAADQLMGVPTTGIEVARTQAKLQRLVEACATAIEVANSAVSPREPAIFEAARAEAHAMVENLRPRIPSVTVYVEPIGLAHELSFDGVVVPEGARSLPYKLNPGTHLLVVQAPGYRSVSEHVTLAEGQKLELRARLVPNPPPPKLAVAPPPPQIDPRIERQRRVRDSLDAEKEAGRMRGYVALGVGGAVLATGIATSVLAVVKTDEAKAQCIEDQCPASAQPEIDRANTISNVANVTLPIGLLAVAYGLFELLTHGDSPVEYVRNARPQVSSAGGFVTLRGEL